LGERANQPLGEAAWAAIRLAYEQGAERIGDIARRHGINSATVSARASQEGWEPRRPDLVAAQRRRAARERPERQDGDVLRRSLHRTLAVMIARLEARVLAAADDIDERDVKMLTALAAAHSKVTAPDSSLDRPNDSSTRSPRDPAHGAPAESGLPRHILDALEQLVDGRAAGLSRRAERRRQT